VSPGAAPSSDAAGRIPYRLRIGVTGQRRLPDDPELREQVRRAVERVRGLITPSLRTAVRLTAVSPLAEGADRLVVREVLKDPKATLQALLPLPVEEYMEDFETEESREEFADLLSRAEQVTLVSDSIADPGSRPKAYERAGHSVADRSDVLIVLWDGEEARREGGTAGTVAYARESQYPIIWVRTEPPFETQEERLSGRTFKEAFRHLDRYNTGAPEAADVAVVVERRKRELLAAAEGVGLTSEHVEPFCSWALPYYSRADALADRQQAWFRRMSRAMFLAAAAAVTIVAAQVIFFPSEPRLALVEVVLLAAVLAVLALDKGLKLHDHWLSYRFLAERFRSALFRALVGVEADPARRAVDTSLTHSPDEWVRRAFDDVWARRPGTSEAVTPIDGWRSFIQDAWVTEQLKYYEGVFPKHARRHRWLTRSSYALLFATLVTAGLHAFGVGGGESAESFTWGRLWIFLAITLPAVAGALSGIQALGQYQRNSERYESMARRLGSVREQLAEASGLEDVRSAVRETEAIMLSENLDWFGTMFFEDMEAHA
jgi:hypothetical protein